MAGVVVLKLLPMDIKQLTELLHPIYQEAVKSLGQNGPFTREIGSLIVRFGGHNGGAVLADLRAGINQEERKQAGTLPPNMALFVHPLAAAKPEAAKPEAVGAETMGKQKTGTPDPDPLKLSPVPPLQSVEAAVGNIPNFINHPAITTDPAQPAGKVIPAANLKGLKPGTLLKNYQRADLEATFLHLGLRIPPGKDTMADLGDTQLAALLIASAK